MYPYGNLDLTRSQLMKLFRKTDFLNTSPSKLGKRTTELLRNENLSHALSSQNLCQSKDKALIPRYELTLMKAKIGMIWAKT